MRLIKKRNVVEATDFRVSAIDIASMESRHTFWAGIF